MAVQIANVMRKRSQSESQFINVVGFMEQGEDEIASSNVVREIAELRAAVRIVAEILNDRAAISDSRVHV